MSGERFNGAFARLFGERLRTERMRLGLTQTAMAQAIGFSRPSVTLYEMGSHVPRVDVLLELQRVGCDVFFLLDGARSQASPGAA